MYKTYSHVGHCQRNSSCISSQVVYFSHHVLILLQNSWYLNTTLGFNLLSILVVAQHTLWLIVCIWITEAAHETAVLYTKMVDKMTFRVPGDFPITHACGNQVQSGLSSEWLHLQCRNFAVTGKLLWTFKYEKPGKIREGRLSLQECCPIYVNLTTIKVHKIVNNKFNTN